MEGSPPERDVLLATKLQVPRSRPGLVPRRRLADQLEEGLNRGLVLVAAPAGYGKSVLLSEWVRDVAQPVAWLSLDAGDNDPVRFWRHVLAALDSVRPGIAERVGPLAGPPPPPSYDALVSALINDVVADPGQPDVLLVLDDYHLISADTLQASVRFLLDHRPPQLRVVLASRSDPPLGLARYRGRGELGEVRAADLRFSVDEAAELLRQVSADLDRSVAAALAERTEGWAVGPAAGGVVASHPARRRPFRGRVHRQPPVRARLPDRGGSRPPATGSARLPAPDVGARASQRVAVQRGHRPR